MAKPSWITLDKSSGTGGGSVSLRASQNRTQVQRSGTVTVKTASGLTKSVSVTQGIYGRSITYWATIEYTGESGNYYEYTYIYQSDTNFSTSSGDSGYLCVAPYHPDLDGDLDLSAARINGPDDSYYEISVQIRKSYVVTSDGEPIDPTDSGWYVSDYSDLSNDETSTLFLFDRDRSSYFTSNTVRYQIGLSGNSSSSSYQIRFRAQSAMSGSYQITIRYKSTTGSYSTRTQTIQGSQIGVGSYGSWITLTGFPKTFVRDFDISVSEMSGSEDVRLVRELSVNLVKMGFVSMTGSSETFSYEFQYTPIAGDNWNVTFSVVTNENETANGITLNHNGNGTFTVSKSHSEQTDSIAEATFSPASIGCMEFQLGNF